MTNSRTLKWITLGVGAFLMGVNLSYSETTSPTAEKKGDWALAVTPYFWFSDIGGTVRYEGVGGAKEADVEVGAGDWLDNLSMGFPLAVDLRHGRWSAFSDIVYMRLDNAKSNVRSVEFGSGNRVEVDASANSETDTTVRMGGWTLLGGYEWLQSKKATLETTGGLRYFSARADSDWNLTADVSGPGPGETFQRSGGVKQSEQLWDALVGVRGLVRLGSDRWTIPYYLDVGTGESDLTWQGSAGIACAFTWGEVSANYRHLEYHVGGSSLVQELRFSGPTIGVTFRFQPAREDS